MAEPVFRRIAVPLDGTIVSEHALPWAMAIAKRASCAIDLVHAALPTVAGTELDGAAMLAGRMPETPTVSTERRIEALVQEIAAAGVRAEAVLLSGPVPSALADYFSRGSVDLIVMTTHDRTRLEHLLLGSVATAVARRVHLPVLLVHQQKERPRLAERQLPAPRHMLIPIDGSAFSEQILPHAANLATLLQADITLLAVLQPVLAVATAALEAGPDPVVALSRPPEDSKEEIRVPALERLADSFRTEHREIAVHTAALADGQPARAIVEYAGRNGIDIIAMTTHGRGGLKRLLAGSVAEAVVRASKAPLLVYRPREV